MAAGEDEAEAVVVDRGHCFLLCVAVGFSSVTLGGLAFGVRLAERVDGCVLRDRREPGSRVVGDAALGPRRQRAGDGVVEGVFGEIPVVGEADEGGDDAQALGRDDLGESCARFGRRA